MERIRVMVTGVGGGGNGEQLVKALRMSDKKYYLIGADITPVSKGLFLVDQKRILPPASDPDYIETLLKVCKEEGVQALFTGSEPELKKVSEVQDEIRAAGIFLPMNPQSVIETCMDKSKTMAWLDAHGFAHPASLTIREQADLDKQVKEKEKLVNNYIETELLPLDHRLRHRGIGLIHGVDFERIGNVSGAVAKECFRRGLVIERSGRNDCVLKLMPALTITEAELAEGLEIIRESMITVLGGR